MSSRATFFLQSCPTCGRKLRIRVEYLGKQVECQHCHALLVAHDSALDSPWRSEETGVMAAAERLLAEADRVLATSSRGLAPHQ
ncbi:MAG: hypothetical protein FJ297_07245 [Planctomycetes bacterium]|nr:hypothetical protein [Planctomycetota bacterium]